MGHWDFGMNVCGMSLGCSTLPPNQRQLHYFGAKSLHSFSLNKINFVQSLNFGQF